MRSSACRPLRRPRAPRAVLPPPLGRPCGPVPCAPRPGPAEGCFHGRGALGRVGGFPRRWHGARRDASPPWSRSVLPAGSPPTSEPFKNPQVACNHSFDNRGHNCPKSMRFKPWERHGFALRFLANSWSERLLPLESPGKDGPSVSLQHRRLLGPATSPGPSASFLS